MKEIVLYTGNSPLEAPLILWNIETAPYQLILYASVTFALRRVYDAPTMSKSPFPCGLRRETLRSSYGFTGIVASTILFNSAQWQIWKNRKPVARRHIAVTSYDHRTGTARWSWGQHRVLGCHLGPKMIVDSCDSRKEPARSPHDALAGLIKSYGHRTVILYPKAMARWSCGRLATWQQFPGDISGCLFHFNNVSNTTTQCDSIWTQFSLLMEAV